MDTVLGAAHGVAPAVFYYFGSGSGMGWFPLVFIIFIVLRIALNSGRARTRRNRNGQRPGNPPDGSHGAPAPMSRMPDGKPDFSRFDASYQPPPADFEPVPGGSAAEQRIAAEQSLKQRLDELDELRRTGRISADEYAAAREQLFRSA